MGHCLKKRDRGLDRSIVLDPLVDPGNPPHRHEACPAAHPACPHPRMVILAQGPSGQRTQGPSQAKIATVMLVDRDARSFIATAAPAELIAQKSQRSSGRT